MNGTIGKTFVDFIVPNVWLRTGNRLYHSKGPFTRCDCDCHFSCRNKWVVQKSMQHQRQGTFKKTSRNRMVAVGL